MFIYEIMPSIMYIALVVIVSIINFYGIFAIINDKDKPNIYATIPLLLFILCTSIAIQEILDNYFNIEFNYNYLLNIIIWTSGIIFFVVLSILALLKTKNTKQSLLVKIIVGYFVLIGIGVLIVFILF